MDVSVLGVAALACISTIVERHFMTASAVWTPLGRRNPFVKDNCLRESLQLLFDSSHAAVLNLFPEQPLVPRVDLLVLYDDAVVML